MEFSVRVRTLTLTLTLFLTLFLTLILTLFLSLTLNLTIVMSSSVFDTLSINGVISKSESGLLSMNAPYFQDNDQEKVRIRVGDGLDRCIGIGLGLVERSVRVRVDDKKVYIRVRVKKSHEGII
jgi:hypothetical protein